MPLIDNSGKPAGQPATVQEAEQRAEDARKAIEEREKQEREALERQQQGGVQLAPGAVIHTPPADRPKGSIAEHAGRKYVVLGDQVGHRLYRGHVVDGRDLADMTDYLLTQRVIRPATEEEARHVRVDLDAAPQGGPGLPASAQDEIGHLRRENERLRAQVADLTGQGNEATRQARERADHNERLRQELEAEKMKADQHRQRAEGAHTQATQHQPAQQQQPAAPAERDEDEGRKGGKGGREKKG